MAKQAALGAQLLVDGFNVSNDIRQVALSSPHGVFPSTGIDKSAMERMLGRKDGRIAVTTFFNPTAGRAHDVFSVLPRTDTQATFQHTQAVGGAAASLLAKQLNHDGDRPADGQLFFQVEALANGFPLEWGNNLTAGSDVLGAAGAGIGFDTGASASFGLQAYLHVLAFTGTSATVTIQDNTTDTPGTYSDVTGAAFAAATAIGGQRIQTTRTQVVRRWVRYNVTGTFSALTLAVNVVKNESAANF